MYYGAIEAGGTKFVCAISDDRFEVIDRTVFPTRSPAATLNQVFEFFDQFSLKSIGIGSFGPIDINKESDTYGYVTTTPKQSWKGFDFLGTVKNRYSVPVAWTTDVNAAAYGEFKKGNAKGTKSCLYLTVGTGIGGGAVVSGEVLEGYGHPEMGHLLVRVHPEDTYQGACPYHDNCLEGLASGPAIEGRYNKKGHELEQDRHVWELEAYYLAQALISYTLTLRPDKIILGGGVMKQEQLFALIRKEFAKMMNDYVKVPDLEKYIVGPGLIEDAGITGSLLLAAKACNE